MPKKYINTRDFGEIAVEENDVIRFVCGMYGFEKYNDYVILKDDPEDDFMFLQAIDNTDLSFVLVDPYAVIRNYEPIVNEEDLKELEVKSEADLKFLIIAIIKENVEDSVVNLKSPIAVNPETRRAKQVILQNSYPLRYNIIVAGEERKC
ncbi:MULTISPECIES: flagellar assembly protein FliW [unclassified Sedimentibacter]|uniref:flagellar assembly protein FliW n=1 Tax=unclassified Sedimentibacter TaxID=2649220 RepID=UPI0027DFECED|nr:flagellar assembly protein FliW [Sedimentibacter sp. MB35-C1]WMJ78590.1 flagellar assembly protein FliW [Sedimentibacter sp. MB35-C1]